MQTAIEYQATRADARKCTEVLELIDEYIPYSYAHRVKEVLDQAGYYITLQMIRNIRSGRTVHLPAVLALRDLAQLPDHIESQVAQLINPDKL